MENCDTIKRKNIWVNTLFTREKKKGWSNNGGAKWFIFETTAKQNKFMKEKINKFHAKVEQIKKDATGNVSVTSILINSIKLKNHKVKEIMNSFNGRLRVDYLLTAEIKDPHNGKFHILGGRKFEDYVYTQVTEFARLHQLDCFIEQRILGINGEIDIILITNHTSQFLEQKLLHYLKAIDQYTIFKEYYQNEN